MSMNQLASLSEDELCLLLFVLNERFPAKFPIDRNMLLSYNIKCMVHYLQKISGDVKDEYKPLFESLFFKITHEMGHEVEVKENLPVSIN